MGFLRRMGALMLALMLIAPCLALADDADEALLGEYDRAGVKIGVSTGSMAMTAAEQYFKNAEIVYLTNNMESVAALENGRIDAFANDAPALTSVVHERPGLKMLDASYGSTDIAVGIGKQRDDLIEPINAALKKIKDTGVLDEMLDRWTRSDNPVMPDIPKPENPTATLDMGTSGLNMPMTYIGENGELTGFDIELAARLALEMNVLLDITTMDFTALVAGLQSGKLDIVISTLHITPERLEMIYFSDPYIVTALTLLVRDPSATRAVTLADLQSYFKKGSKVGVVTGAVFDLVAEKHLPDAEIVYFANTADLVLAMRDGKIDGYVTDMPQAKAQCVTDDKLWMPDINLEDDLYGFAIRKDNAKLVEQVNQTLSRLRADGLLEPMAEKWFGADEALKPMPDFAYTGEKGALTLYASDTAYPFCYSRDNKSVGYEIELFLYICRDHGYTPVIYNADFTSIISAITSNKADIACNCISITEERKEKMNFSDPTYYGGIVAVLPASARAAMTGQAAQIEAEKGFFEELSASFERTFVKEGRWRMVVNGLLVTLLISLLAGILGTVLGFLICMMRRSRFSVVRGIAGTYISIVQGTPIVVILMIFFYVIFGSMDAIPVAIIGFAVNFAAYVSEMMRAGIDAVGKGQWEAASAVGFTRAQTFLTIIMPQAARHFLPVFRGEFISMVKMTSVVGYITIQDLTKVSDIIRSRTYEAFFPLIVTAIIYFLLSRLIAGGLTALDKRINPKYKQRVLKGVIEL